MNISNYKVFIEAHPYSSAKRLYFYRQARGGVYFLKIKEGNLCEEVFLEEGQIRAGECSLIIENEIFQALVDAIQGRFKSSEGRFVEGKLEATEKHLEDMRKLVFVNTNKEI